MIFILLAWHIPKRAHFKMSIFQKQHIQHLGPYSRKCTFQQEHIPKTAYSTFKALFQKGLISIGAYSKNSKFYIQGHIPKRAHIKMKIFQNSTFYIQDHIMKRCASKTSLKIFIIFIFLPNQSTMSLSKKGIFQNEHIPKTAHSTFRTTQ